MIKGLTIGKMKKKKTENSSLFFIFLFMQRGGKINLTYGPNASSIHFLLAMYVPATKNYNLDFLSQNQFLENNYVLTRFLAKFSDPTCSSRHIEAKYKSENEKINYPLPGNSSRQSRLLRARKLGLQPLHKKKI